MRRRRRLMIWIIGSRRWGMRFNSCRTILLSIIRAIGKLWTLEALIRGHPTVRETLKNSGRRKIF